MAKYIVWLVDEDPHDADTGKRLLSHMLGVEVEVRTICPPLEKKEDYAGILQDERTGSIILDQRLMERDQVSYTGIELAQYLRSIDSKMPLYILTAWPDDYAAFEGGRWSVEEVFDKDDLSLGEDAVNISSKILRHMNVYHDILKEREQRFHDLLQKSLQDELSEAERDELSRLHTARAKPVIANEISELEELEELLREHKAILARLNDLNRGTEEG